jgi:hypothetical protein
MSKLTDIVLLPTTKKVCGLGHPRAAGSGDCSWYLGHRQIAPDSLRARKDGRVTTTSHFDVRFGSLADIRRGLNDVRYSPKSGH